MGSKVGAAVGASSGADLEATDLGSLLPSRHPGRLIAAYRKQRKQLHNQRPWTQEDLAVAAGTDKSHINRIERERQMPTRETVIRIARGLDLTSDQEQELLIVAGYAPELALPTETEIDDAIAQVKPLIDNLPYPAVLFDILGRFWYWNPVWLAFYSRLMGISVGEVQRSSRGKSVIELYFGEETAAWYRRILPEEHVCRLVVRFRRLAGLWQQTFEYRSLIRQLVRHPQFLTMWRDALVNDSLHIDYIDRARSTIGHQEFGRLGLDIWWTRLLRDPRFVVGHHLPADDATRSAYARCAGQARHLGSGDS